MVVQRVPREHTFAPTKLQTSTASAVREIVIVSETRYNATRQSAATKHPYPDIEGERVR